MVFLSYVLHQGVPDQALERITMPGTPETAAPRRPNLEVPMTPPEDLPQPGPSTTWNVTVCFLSFTAVTPLSRSPLEDESFQVRWAQ